jgi:hypothetical protein
MRRGVAAALAVALTACGQKSAPAGENQAQAVEKTTVPAANASGESNAPVNGAAASGSAALPPASAKLRFVGTWAANRADCASKPWRFTEHELTATGGPHCSLYKVTDVPGGYDLAAECPAKKPVPTDLIKLRFAESAQAMLVESNAIPPMGLVYCGK